VTTSLFLSLLVTGVAIGVFSGMVGIGGGIMVIPALMFFYELDQAKANGTSLAMLLPPIGIFAVLSYARAGNVNWGYAALLAVGFAAGAYIGARLVNANLINPTALRIAFAMLLVYSACRLLFRGGTPAMSALQTSILMGAFAITYATLRLLGRKWERPSPNWGAVYRNKRSETYEYDYEI